MQFEHHKPATEAGQVFTCTCEINRNERLHVYANSGHMPSVTVALFGEVAGQSLRLTPDLARALALRLMAAADALEG